MPKLDRIPKATRRRALELLAGSRDGCTEAIMLAHGFKTAMLVEMVRAGARDGEGRARGRRWAHHAGYPREDHRGGKASAGAASMALILELLAQLRGNAMSHGSKSYIRALVLFLLVLPVGVVWLWDELRENN